MYFKFDKCLSTFEVQCVTVCSVKYIFGRPFVKRFALYCRIVVCLSICLSCPVCLSVCDVGVLWPNGWMDQDETWHGMQVSLDPGHIVRWGPSSPTHRKGHSSPHFQNLWAQALRASVYNALPMSIVSKRHGGSRCHLVGR